MNQSSARQPRFDPLPRQTTPAGDARRIGLELEVAEVRPQAMAEAVTAVVGGSIEHESAFLTRVRATEFGDFNIELDASILRDRRYQQALAEIGIDIGEGSARDNIEDLMSRVAGLIVPRELVGPPIPWTEFARLDEIRLRLHKAGAKGTHSSPFYAFGLQLNIEAASLDADYLLNMLRAFLLKYEWLLERSDVDLARRISPYVQSYPEDYVAHVLNPDYQPDLTTLIDDFLYYTPTRNRPLDLLPLFAHIDEQRVMAAPVEKELIKPRPAFHYRLPNCLIDEPDWNLSVPWNDWVAVERLAAEPRALEKECTSRLKSSSPVKRWLSALVRKLRS
ncbi:amidoligase family protein [Wenzhouxiangella limi]|uniref:Amidoligase enzyme n=1 Tax=Wenzhouxiangella limi TaxID=2707351 RepID=A0A845UWX8_9GAMM|nr:amidoligase family protein [Wenzhouxiangella limi]NDY95927.1 amidoligase enzyme [Wenzhouxiangella limi]